MLQKGIGGQARENLGEGIYRVFMAGVADVTDGYQDVINSLAAAPFEQVENVLLSGRNRGYSSTLPRLWQYL